MRFAITLGAACAFVFGAPPLAATQRAPIEQWESLKFDDVNGRTGPSFDHPIAWRYRQTGLPVEVIAESADWRRIRDPDGDEVWVHQRTLSSQDHIIVKPERGPAAPLRRAPRDNARIIADVERGVVFDLDRCVDGWRRVSGQRRGWMRDADVWGDDCGETSENVKT